MRRVHERLAAGDVVVVWRPCPASRAHARVAARELHAELVAGLTAPLLGASRTSTSGVCGVALCRDRRVGLDVERVDPGLIDESVLELMLHPAERAAAAAADADARFAIWVRKEAALKGMGLGLSRDPASLCVGSESRSWCLVEGISLLSLRTPAGIPAALACSGGPAGVHVEGGCSP